MKADIHPEVREVIFRDGIEGALFKILSCAETKETITVDGQEYPLVKSDITSASHPFYTGAWGCSPFEPATPDHSPEKIFTALHTRPPPQKSEVISSHTYNSINYYLYVECERHQRAN